jgi:hypothetical protein
MQICTSRIPGYTPTNAMIMTLRLASKRHKTNFPLLTLRVRCFGMFWLCGKCAALKLRHQDSSRRSLAESVSAG